MKVVIILRRNSIITIMVMMAFYFFTVPVLYAQDKDSTGTKKDSTSKKQLSLDAYPYAFYTPETELAIGAGGILIFFAGDSSITKPSKVVLGGYYTTNNQYYLSLDPEMYFYDNKLFVSAPLSLGYYVTRFYGIGPATADTGNVDYISRVYTGTLSVLGPSLWLTADKAGIVFDFNYTEMVDKENNSYLENNEVLGSEGGQYLGIGLNAVWDTRDNLFFPNDGKYTSLKFVSYPIGEFIYYTTEFDVRSYTSFSKNHVLAGQFYLFNAIGEVPFYALPKLGGQYKMRGYYEGRYVDNAYFTLQLEYRQYFWWRFGYVVFGSVGTVASSPDKYQMSEMKISYGAGLRFLFNEAQMVNLRMDLGITREGDKAVYFGIEEAF
jgi:outer membrane protein assembly factor BamA